MISFIPFGILPDGRAVQAAILDNGRRRAVILSYGGRLHHFSGSDGFNIVKSLPDVESYARDRHYHGALIGPVANRIQGARFEIDGQSYALDENEAGVCLHSGPNGFQNQIWEMRAEGETLVLDYTAPDGQGGFPGNVGVNIRISLRDDTLQVSFTASSDRPTPLNITWHPYFNLSGEPTINEHKLNGTDIGTRATDASYRRGGDCLRAVTQLMRRNRALTIFTDYPEVQIYTGDGLLSPRAAIAIEPQFAPNDINGAKDTLLRPDDIYLKVIFYRLELANE